MDELMETKIYNRDEIELTWRNEFDDLGEEGVRHELFKSAYLSDRRKEGFAYRWLGEKRKEQQRLDAGKKRRNFLMAVVILACFVILAEFSWAYSVHEILDRSWSALQLSWNVIAGFYF